MRVFVSTRESVERIKDIISQDIQGCIFDYHVADALKMDYVTLRIAISKNRNPVEEIAMFCYSKNLIVNDFIFPKN